MSQLALLQGCSLKVTSEADHPSFLGSQFQPNQAKMSLKSKLMMEIAEPMTSSGNKVTVVGIGQVGMACAFSILTQVSWPHNSWIIRILIQVLFSERIQRSSPHRCKRGQAPGWNAGSAARFRLHEERPDPGQHRSVTLFATSESSSIGWLTSVLRKELSLSVQSVAEVYPCVPIKGESKS